mmetsp:Transcript_28094/g.39503  ORF Transcript_28094/g.39503 Transcript_28094/m.39503 type:complete len:700 (+) Transcript_28094:130-2229(+)
MIRKSNYLTVLVWISVVWKSRPFVPPHLGGNGQGGGRGGKNNGGPPKSFNDDFGGKPHSDGDNFPYLSCNAKANDKIDNNVELRGGSTQEVVSGSKHTLSKTASYWSRLFQTVGYKASKPVQSASNQIKTLLKRKSKEEKEQEALLEELKSTPVAAVSVPNTTVLPPEVINIAAKRSGLLGRPLRYEAVQEMARALKQWYSRKGYVLHSVTGATLRAEDATAVIQVQEPKVSNAPVGITICKEMVVDEDTGNVLTIRQYKERQAKRKVVGYRNIKKSDLNTTYVQTEGRTNPERIANALELKPGKPFKWEPNRWQKVLGSGIFGRVIKASPQRMKDGTVQFHVIATERAPRNLEYGVSKSLYTNSWEGELEFEHGNLLGGGEILGLQVRRGTKDAEPSVKVRYSDSKFGRAGGFDCEAFSDFIADDYTSDNSELDKTSADSEEANEVVMDYDQDVPLGRRGAMFSLQNPISTKMVRHSSASVTLERVTTRTGLHENIGAATLNVGPFRKELPSDARLNILGTVTTGSRLRATDDQEISSAFVGWRMLPYSVVSATTRQVFPLVNNALNGRSLDLALSHSLMTSTPNFPRHEAHKAGIASQVRGYDGHMGSVTTSIKGTTELRIPVPLPTDKLSQDASLVLWTDWRYAKSSRRDSAFSRKSSIGAGVRKSLQGLPLKWDISYTQDGKIKSNLGLGMDFDA